MTRGADAPRFKFYKASLAIERHLCDIAAILGDHSPARGAVRPEIGRYGGDKHLIRGSVHPFCHSSLPARSPLWLCPQRHDLPARAALHLIAIIGPPLRNRDALLPAVVAVIGGLYLVPLGMRQMALYCIMRPAA